MITRTDPMIDSSRIALQMHRVVDVTVVGYLTLVIHHNDRNGVVTLHHA